MSCAKSVDSPIRTKIRDSTKNRVDPTKSRYYASMSKSNPLRGLISDPKKLLLELAGQHQLSDLLPFAVERMAEGPTIALVRIWLKLPTESSDCAKCRFANECPNRDSCLHLVASAGQSLEASSVPWSNLEGEFRRFPLGIRKVGQIATSGRSLEVSNVETTHQSQLCRDTS